MRALSRVCPDIGRLVAGGAFAVLDHGIAEYRVIRQ